jgi:uncharacterized protein YbjT (DUF2867 family)
MRSSRTRRAPTSPTGESGEHVRAQAGGLMHVFVTGGTGYLGTRLVHELLARGHEVRVLTRPGSVGRVPPGAGVVVGDALDPAAVVAALRAGDTLVHLVGTPRPSPRKTAELVRVDLASAQAAVAAARGAGVAHFVYVSVAQPAPVMRAYVAARAEGERILRASGLTATVLRPWYVLGPGHRWAHGLRPVYAVVGLLPPWRDGARRLCLVTLPQMVEALVRAVEHPPEAGRVRVVEAAEIRGGGEAGPRS